MRFFCEVKKHEIEIKMEPIISFCILYSRSESSFNSSTFIDLVESGFLHVLMFFKREGGGVKFLVFMLTLNVGKFIHNGKNLK